MSRVVNAETHKMLSWIAGVMSTLATAGIMWMAGALISVRDSQIRMERLPAQVDKHELRLNVHDQRLHINTQMQTNDQ